MAKAPSSESEASMATADGAGPGQPARRERNGRLRRGAYLLPSLFTMGNMLLGFYALVAGFRGDPGKAALLVFAAGFLDAIDGRIARMTGTESEFGKEFDSLADLFTFGATPALLAFFAGLHELGRPGWLIPAFYMLCTATRLARFNVQAKVVDSRYFVGLPSPAAAGSVCSVLLFTGWVAEQFGQPDSWVPQVASAEVWSDFLRGALIVSLLLFGALEISTFRYRSPKQLNLRRKFSYRVAVPIAAILLVIVWEPAAFFLTVALLYTTSGPLAWLLGRLRRGSGSPSDSSSDSTSGEPPGDDPGLPAGDEHLEETQRLERHRLP